MRRFIFGIALLILAACALWIVLHVSGEAYAFAAGVLLMSFAVGAVESLIGYVQAGEESRRYYEDGGRRNMDAHGERMMEIIRRQQEGRP